jgi:hypothetical protein
VGHRWEQSEAGVGGIAEGARRAGVYCAAAEMEGVRSRSSEVAARDVTGEVDIGLGLGEARSRARVGRCRGSREGRCCMRAMEDYWRQVLGRVLHR